MWLKYFLTVAFLCASPIQGLLDVQCRFESLGQTGRVICECNSFGASSANYEDLSDTLYNFVNNRFRQSLGFSSVALNNCKSIKITVDFQALAPLSSQKITYVSFENTDNLELYLDNLDSGDKTIITEDIDFLTLKGRMYETSASLRFFLRQSSSILFNDFYASTPISLINIQDVNSLKVTDSGFESVFTAEFIRVSSCQNEVGVTSCSQTSLFPKSSVSGSGLDSNTILLIVGLTLLVVAVIVGIAMAIYIWRWRKRKDLELLGYPPKPAVNFPRSNLSSGGHSSENSGIKTRY